MGIGELVTRRDWAARTTAFLGGLALAGLDGHVCKAESPTGLPQPPRPSRARRVIFLFQSGGPSHLDLFDPKPKLNEMHGQEIPPSVRGDQITTVMTRLQASFPLIGCPFAFRKAGRVGTDLSELLPYTAGVADEITLIRSMVTEPINHDPAATFWLTGAQRPGRPTVGAWLSYGLGSVNRNLPDYVVMLSGSGGQPPQATYWGSGFPFVKNSRFVFTPAPAAENTPARQRHGAPQVAVVRQLPLGLHQGVLVDPEQDALVQHDPAPPAVPQRPAESARELDALLPSVLNKAFAGEL